MSNEREPSKIIQATDGPTGKFIYRVGTGMISLFTAGVLTWGLGEYSAFKRDITEMKLVAATAAGNVLLLEYKVNALAGRVTGLDGRVDKVDDKITIIQLKMH